LRQFPHKVVFKDHLLLVEGFTSHPVREEMRRDFIANQSERRRKARGKVNSKIMKVYLLVQL